jgi:hypothetical protein
MQLDDMFAYTLSTLAQALWWHVDVSSPAPPAFVRALLAGPPTPSQFAREKLEAWLLTAGESLAEDVDPGNRVASLDRSSVRMQNSPKKKSLLPSPAALTALCPSLHRGTGEIV